MNIFLPHFICGQIYHFLSVFFFFLCWGKTREVVSVNLYIEELDRKDWFGSWSVVAEAVDGAHLQIRQQGQIWLLQ